MGNSVLRKQNYYCIYAAMPLACCLCIRCDRHNANPCLSKISPTAALINITPMLVWFRWGWCLGHTASNCEAADGLVSVLKSIYYGQDPGTAALQLTRMPALTHPCDVKLCSEAHFNKPLLTFSPSSVTLLLEIPALSYHVYRHFNCSRGNDPRGQWGTRQQIWLQEYRYP